MGRSGNNGSGRAGHTMRAKAVGNMKVPGGRFGYRMEEKKAYADQRTADRNNRTPQQQLALLDQRLGKGQGATRERERLHKQIAAGGNDGS